MPVGTLAWALPLRHRISVAILALVLTLAFAHWLQGRGPLEARLAAAMAGEAWYALHFLDAAPIGYFSTNSWRDWRGYWRFESFMHFSLAGNPPQSISETLRFAPVPPFGLAAAEQWRHKPGALAEGLRVQRNAEILDLSFTRGGAVSSSEALDWDFTLGDHLAVDAWLAGNRPQAGARFAGKLPDFEVGRLVNKVFRVVERNAIGYVLASATPLQATEIQMDGRFRPVAFSVAGLFRLQRTAKARALAVRTPLHLSDHRIPLDEPLANHRNIRRLVLSASRSHDLGLIWPQAQRRLDGWRLSLPAAPSSTRRELAESLRETLAYPVSHAEVRRLAQRAAPTGLGSEEERLAALVTFVNGYLAYRANAAPTTVLETMATRTGDCTEYADLLTTLARALGWPARTVLGLAYSQQGGPALAFHAWNEVALAGVWRPVDPAWNQTWVDATHIPLAGDLAPLLRLMSVQKDLRFGVEAVEYR